MFQQQSTTNSWSTLN